MNPFTVLPTEVDAQCHNTTRANNSVQVIKNVTLGSPPIYVISVSNYKLLCEEHMEEDSNDFTLKFRANNVVRLLQANNKDIKEKDA